MKTTIETMWAALAEYQAQANANGHGKTWAHMCREKTADAARAAAAAVADAAVADAAYAAAYAAAASEVHAEEAAAYAAYAAAAAAYDVLAESALDQINKAKEEKQNGN